MHKILFVTILFQSSFICAPPKSLKELAFHFVIAQAKKKPFRFSQPLYDVFRSLYSLERADPFTYVEVADLLSFTQDTEEGVQYIASLLGSVSRNILHDMHSGPLLRNSGQLRNFVNLSNKVNALPEHLSAAIRTARNALNDVKLKKPTTSSAARAE